MDDRTLPADDAWPLPLPAVLEALRVEDEVRLDLGPAGTLVLRWVPAAVETQPGELPVLLGRTREVLRMVADGLPAAVVAETLGLPLTVVADELTTLRARYGVESTAAAVQQARSVGDLD